jgi:rRNA processing protein Gar1
MKHLSLPGAAIAASLFALPGLALAATTPNPANTDNNNAADTNNSAPANQSVTATGAGGYTGTELPIHNNTGDNAGATASMRPSQRNADLADNGTVRAGKVIGTDVYNDQNQKIGSVDDVLIGKDNRIWAVISTDKQKVAVPFKNFIFGDAKQVSHDKMVLPNMTQAKLDSMPKFDYDASNYASNNNRSGNGNGVFGNRAAPGAPAAVPPGNANTNQANNAKTNG